MTHVVSEDESWFFYWDPGSKRSSMEWIAPGQQRSEKARIEHMTQKVMLVAFIDCRGCVYHEFVPNGISIGVEVYLWILTRFQDAFHQRCADLWTGQADSQWALLHDGTPAHKARDVLTFLCNHNIHVLPHAGYSPDLNPPDYWFFKCQKDTSRMLIP